MEHAQYDSLVGAIYDAVEEPLRLKQALAEIVAATNAAGAHIVGFNKKSREVVLSSISGLPLLGEIDYNERYGKIDPRFPACLAAPVGQLISCHEYLDESFVERSEFFQDFYIPYGCRYLTAVKLTESDACVTIMGVIASVTSGPLGLEPLSFLRRLTPHCQRAMQLIAQHARLQNQWSIVKATLDGLDYGALICDERAVVLVANEAALSLFESRDGLSLRDDAIFVGDPRGRLRLRSMLLAEGDASHARSTHRAERALLVPRPSGLPSYQLIVRRIERERSAFSFDNRWLWSVTISDPAHVSVPTLRALALLYDLTPAETGIATLLVSGASPEEMAERMHLKISTVRSQLSSLYAKTGTRRQAELVRLFSAVPVLREPQAIALP